MDSERCWVCEVLDEEFKAMRIYLCRHAQEAESPYEPQEAITDLGKEQARALGKFLSDKGIAVLYSSDLPRALRTAEVVGEVLNLKPKVLKELREISTSSPEDWSDYVQKHHPDFDFLVGGRESLVMVMERGRKAWERIIRGEKGKNIAVVGHGVFTKALLYSLGYRDYLIRNDHIANTGVTIFEHEDGKTKLVEFNYYGHLPSG